MSKTILWIIGILIGVVIVFWVGTHVTPRPFSTYPVTSRDFETIPLPDDLPAPVDRFYRLVYGEDIPVIESFILSGRGSIRFQGVTLPARLRFTHQSGKNYRHYMETTVWTVPILKVNEYFLDGKSRLELPFGVVENEPQVDQAANLGLWSETMIFSAVYLTAPGVRWEPIDTHSARLVVPLNAQEDNFTVYFDPETGLIEVMEALRWKEAGDLEKTLWQAQALTWGELQGWKMPVDFAAQWMDEQTPWLVAQIEEVTWNVDVSEYILDAGE